MILPDPDPISVDLRDATARVIRVPAATGDPVVLFTLGRSGTHLAIDIIRRQFRAFSAWKWPGEPAHHLYVVPEHVVNGKCPAERASRVLRKSRRPIILTHQWTGMLPALSKLQPDFARWLEHRASVVLLVRDPVVVLTKMFAMFAIIRETRGDHFYDLDPDTFVAEQATRWVAHAATGAGGNALALRFEELMGDPGETIARLGRFLHETPLLKTPMLVRPRRTVLDRGVSRLHPRPPSSHVILPDAAARKFRLEWTRDRLAILDRIAGETMEAMGYARPVSRDPAEGWTAVRAA